MTDILDIDTPIDARKYISLTANSLVQGRILSYVKMVSGEIIEFNNMTDEQAIRVARSLYLDIELPAAKGARKQ